MESLAENYSLFLFGSENEEPKSADDVGDGPKWTCSVEDQMWNLVASKLAFEDQMRSKTDRNSAAEMQLNSNGGSHTKVSRGKQSKHAIEAAKGEFVVKLLTMDMKLSGMVQKPGLLSVVSNSSTVMIAPNGAEKRFKSLPSAETLPRNEPLGGYIFVCNNDTMQEDLKRRLFGLPQRYRDSVRAIQPGLPLFLYNYTAHQLHGIFEATSFGGSNIDPSAWEDKKCKGESRFPAQVRTRVRKLCKPLEEDSFRPVLYHYDGPKFRLQLSVPETLALLDLFSENGTV